MDAKEYAKDYVAVELYDEELCLAIEDAWEAGYAQCKIDFALESKQD